MMLKELFTAEKWLKTVAGLLTAIIFIVGTCWAAYSHFSTDTERIAAIAMVTKAHDEHKQTVVVASNRAEIWRAKREIKRLQRALEDPDLPHAERVRVQNDIKDYEDLIDCIREGKELCY